MSKMLKGALMVAVLAVFTTGSVFGLKLPSAGDLKLDTKKVSAKEGDDVKVQKFEEHKDTILAAYEYLPDFSKLSSDSAVLEQLDAAQEIIARSEKAVAELTEALGGSSLGNYNNVNDETKKISFGSKASRVSSYLRMAKERIEKLQRNMYSMIKGRTGWLEGSAQVQKAARWRAEIDQYFAALEKIDPKDPKIASAKKEYIPRADAAYKKAMEQLEDSRMEGDKYSKSDAATLKKTLKDLYVKEYGHQIARITIVNSSWIAKEELAWDSDSIWLEENHYIAAHVAIEKGKTTMVYSVNYKKRKNNSGFDPIRIHGVGAGYPVLTENINK